VRSHHYVEVLEAGKEEQIKNLKEQAQYFLNKKDEELRTFVAEFETYREAKDAEVKQLSAESTYLHAWAMVGVGDASTSSTFRECSSSPSVIRSRPLTHTSTPSHPSPPSHLHHLHTFTPSPPSQPSQPSHHHTFHVHRDTSALSAPKRPRVLSF
jgi:hypothetical protein